jgi:hypothetical protein
VSRDDGGLGLTCPVVMVHGNHEGFEHPSAMHWGTCSPATLGLFLEAEAVEMHHGDSKYLNSNTNDKYTVRIDYSMTVVGEIDKILSGSFVAPDDQYFTLRGVELVATPTVLIGKSEFELSDMELKTEKIPSGVLTKASKG